MEEALQTTVDEIVENQTLIEKASKVIGSGAVEAVKDNAQSIVHALENIPVMGILQGAGTIAAAFPFIYPIHILLKTIGDAVRVARFNKESANMLLERCIDTEKVINELAPTLADIAKEDESLMKPLEIALEESLEFLQRFTSKGFLNKMWQGLKNTMKNKDNEHRLSLYDKRIVGAIQNLSLRIDDRQLKMQMLSAEKMDKLFLMLSQKVGNETDISNVEPVVMAEIAQAGGCTSAEDISGELEGLGFKLDEIKKAVDDVMQRLEAMDRKLDYVGNSIDESRKLQLEANELHKQTLNEMKQLKSSTGLSIPQLFSTQQQVIYMAEKAISVKRHGGVRITMVHPAGVGMDSYQRLDGRGGANGCTVRGTHKPAASGTNGGPGDDGGDGVDGEDGEDGEDGHDGHNGADAGDFEVMIKCIGENKAEGTRAYRIEYAGRGTKDEEVVELRFPGSVIYIDGCGGAGGKGGDGGNGGGGGAGGSGGRGGDGVMKQDGGNGGNGGNGGVGGLGGVGGDGGSGGRGAKVVIHTDDPAILRLVEVNVSGGKGGLGGSHGVAGVGGLGGPGGLPGRAGSYARSVIKVNEKGKPYTATETVSERNGKRGKAGKIGKKGKNKRLKPSRSGKDGEFGQVSFCIYGKEGLKESGGTPFRLMFPKRQIKNLLPLSLPFGIPPVLPTEGKPTPTTNTSVYLYGGKLTFGPVSPINIGGLICPESELVGAMCFGPNNAVVIASTQVTFPEIPAAQSTTYGELSVDKQKVLEVVLPHMEAPCFSYQPINPLAFPWDMHAKPFSVTYDAVFRICMSVDEVEFVGNAEVDGDLICAKEYPVSIGVPLEMYSSPFDSVLKRLTVLPSVVLGDSNHFTLSYAIRNKLLAETVSCVDNAFKCILRVVSPGFQMHVVTDSGTLHQTSSHVNEYTMDTYEFTLGDVAPGGVVNMQYGLQLPSTGPSLGHMVYVRSELYSKGKLVECSPPSTIRIVPPVPQPPAAVSVTDILFVTNSNMAVRDYKLLTALCTCMGMRAHFLDCEHVYSTSKAGALQTPGGNGVHLSLWEKFKGRCTLVWLPATSNQAAAIPRADLQNHLDSGGSLVCNARVQFRCARPVTDAPEAGSKRCVITADAFQLSLGNDEMAVQGKVSGTVLSTLAMNIIAAMSTIQKLEFMHTHGNYLNVTLGDFKIQNFSYVPKGCCSCFSQPKIMPSQDTPFNLRDCLTAAITADLKIDMYFYEKHTINDKCYAMNHIVQFAKGEIMKAARNSALTEVACAIAVCLVINGVTKADTPFSEAAMKRWSALRKVLLRISKKCAALSRTQWEGQKSRVLLVSAIGNKHFPPNRAHKLNENSYMAFDVSMPKK